MTILFASTHTTPHGPPRAAFWLAFTFCVLVFVLNSFSVLVTYMMSSVWHAILDNFRPITIWVVQLSIYYCFNGKENGYGEAWTAGSWLELGGMALLLVGTAISPPPATASPTAAARARALVTPPAGAAGTILLL